MCEWYRYGRDVSNKSSVIVHESSEVPDFLFEIRLDKVPNC